MAQPILTLKRQTYFRRKRALVAVSRMPRQLPMDQHRHEFFEIAVVLSGSALHVIGGRRHRLETGDVVFLDPGHAHGYEETRSLNLLNILVRADALARIGREMTDRPGYHALFSLAPVRKARGFPPRLRLSVADLEQIEEWAARIEEEERRPGSRTGLLEEAYLTLIIDVLSQKYGHSLRRGPVKLTEPGAPFRLQARLGRILSWIEINLARPLYVSELAARAGMSERTFHRAFRAVTGTSPHTHILRARLSRAAQRLIDKALDESITETAQACGFDDSNYFSRAFRHFSGMSPRDYRRRQKAGAELRS